MFSAALSGPSEQIFRHVQSLDNDRTVVILDPPRKGQQPLADPLCRLRCGHDSWVYVCVRVVVGCDENFMDQLFLFWPKKIVYVSCDPATQARDAKLVRT